MVCAYVFINSCLESITILTAPLNINALTCISTNTVTTINKAFHSLRSNLFILENLQHPILWHYVMFLEFFLSPNRCTHLCIIVYKKGQHNCIKLRCMQLICQHLWKDICDLWAIGASLSDIQPSLAVKCFFLAFHYACCYWVHHVCKGNIVFTDVEAISAFLHKQLLHGLETLSLVEHMRKSHCYVGRARICHGEKATHRNQHY